MGESNQEQRKGERRFSWEQYEMLLRCSEKGEVGIKKWNEWREANPEEDGCDCKANTGVCNPTKRGVKY